MNLFWLKYVSYAFLAGASVLYLLLRIKPLAGSRISRILLYCGCVVLTGVTWYVQESSAQNHSPRRLVVGRVSSVSANRHKGGGIDDDFQVNVGGKSLSPSFSTNIVASSADQQPIHQGDLVGVLYRTWDDVPLTIDELQGQRPGWHYTRYDKVGSYIIAVSLVGAVLLLSIIFGKPRKAVRENATALNLTD